MTDHHGSDNAYQKKSRQSKSPADTQLKSDEKSPNINGNNPQTCQISSKDDDSSRSSNTSQNVAGKSNTGQKEEASTMTDLQEILNIMEDIPKVLKHEPRLISVIQSVLEIAKTKSSDVSFAILMFFLRNFESIPENCLTNFKKTLEDTLLPNELWRHLIDFDDLDYRESIGHGSFSVVYRAHLVQNGKRKTVAVKESSDPSFNKMFTEEAKMLLEFNHDNVLKIVGICMTNGIKLVLEYMECGILMEYLQEEEEENRKILLKVIYQVANGLAYIAEKKYIHRDLHVNNILIDKDGNSKISDFGLCKYLGNAAKEYIDKNPKVTGFWNAPEVLSKGKYSYKSDVFSLSILCFQIFGGVPKNWFQSMLITHLFESGNLPTWDAIKHHCPEKLFKVMQSGTSPNPHDRPDAIVFKNVVKKYVV